MKELISLVQDNFQETLKKWVTKTTGITARKVEVKDVVKKEELGNKETIALYECLFSSEAGIHSYILGLKQFKTIIEATKEANGSFLLQEMIKNDSKVLTPFLQYFSYEYKTIIYDYPVKAEGFYTAKLDEPRKFYLAGRSLPYIHGLEGFNQIDVDRYMTRVKTAIEGIQPPDNFFNQVLEFFKEELIQWRVSMGGARCYRTFGQDSIIYEETEEPFGKSGDDKLDYRKLWLLHPSGINNEKVFDRFEDIGSFLLEPAYEEFNQHGNLEKTTNNLVFMMNGYNSVLVSTIGIQLQELYKEGLPITLQLLLRCLEEIAENIGNFQLEEIEKRKEFLQYLIETPVEY
ncbi:MAG: hypothetical protein ACFFD4_29665 [Candidatus Odinarchaeota archaeon]